MRYVRLGEILRTLRLTAGYTLTGLADKYKIKAKEVFGGEPGAKNSSKLTIKHSSLSNHERGKDARSRGESDKNKTYPDPDVLRVLAAIYGVPYDELLRRKNEEQELREWLERWGHDLDDICTNDDTEETSLEAIREIVETNFEGYLKRLGDAHFAEAEKLMVPAITHHDSPRRYAYVPTDQGISELTDQQPAIGYLVEPDQKVHRIPSSGIRIGRNWPEVDEGPPELREIKAYLNVPEPDGGTLNASASTVSNRHAFIYRDSVGVVLVDGNGAGKSSSNGTYIRRGDGWKRIKDRHILDHEDRIRFGLDDETEYTYQHQFKIDGALLKSEAPEQTHAARVYQEPPTSMGTPGKNAEKSG